MLRKCRDVLSLIVFVVVLSISLAAAVEAARQGLPEPVVADPTERLVWLSEHDVRDQPAEVKQRLVRRLEEDFSKNFDWEAAIAKFNDEQWQRFDANFDDLMRLWFTQKVDTWSSLPAEQQPYYLDDQLGYLMSWRPLDRSATTAKKPGAGRRGQGQLARFGGIGKRLRGWVETQSPAERARIEAFGKAVVDRVVQRMTNPTPLGPGLE